MLSGQTVGLVTSCIVTQEEQGQTPAKCSDATQSLTRMSNDMGSCIGGTSGVEVEKAAWKADSVQSVLKTQSYETDEEKCQFICERNK